jgi:hypothetical protein
VDYGDRERYLADDERTTPDENQPTNPGTGKLRSRTQTENQFVDWFQPVYFSGGGLADNTWEIGFDPDGSAAGKWPPRVLHGPTDLVDLATKKCPCPIVDFLHRVRQIGIRTSYQLRLVREHHHSRPLGGQETRRPIHTELDVFIDNLRARGARPVLDGIGARRNLCWPGLFSAGTPQRR